MRSYLKVFLIIYIPIVIILGIGYKVTNNVMVKNATKEIHTEMEANAEILRGYKIGETFNPEIHTVLKNISKNTTLRVTIIRKDGKVIDDSYYDLPKINTMENHSHRPEVIKALQTGAGSSLRRSTTAEESMNYYAVKYDNNIILRIAYPVSYIQSLQDSILQQNITIYLTLLLTVGIIALYLARRISKPIKQLSEVADKIEAGESKIDFPSFSDKTLTKLVSVIYRIYSSMNQKAKLLEQEKQKLNHIFSILDEGIILLDGKNTVIHFNLKADHYLGMNIRIGENILKQTNDMESLSFLKEIASQTESSQHHIKLKGKIYEVFIKIFENEKLAAFYDITERAEYEQFKTELIGNITHELKTPLAMIMGYSETIMNDPDMDKKFHDKFINIIYNSSNRLNLLINDILKLHKLEMLKEDIKVEETTMGTDLCDEIEAYYQDRPQNIIINSNAGEIYILREHLISIITNLIDNAIKYSTGENITLDLTQTDENFKLEVSDEGPAIPAEEQQRIFERFYTMDKSKNQNSTGTGLGLSIVKHIVSLYNGEVFVKNNRKHGNTFTIILEEKRND